MHRSVLPPAPARARLLASAVWLFAAGWSAPAAAQSIMPVDVSAGPLDSSLTSLAQQTGQQLLYPADLVTGRRAPALRGEFTPEDALQRLLAGTDVTVTRTGPNVLVLRRASPAPPPETGRPQTSGPFVADDEAAPLGESRAELAADPTLVDEVTIVGSLIRGAPQGPSPVLILDRGQLDRSGYATVAGALAALPQNFAGTVGEGLNNNGGERQGSNTHFASGLNLRGLGSDATLVLVNGRRMAGAGSNAEFADISTIPTAAVERVEILLDGASALYGSDAVGGVVNIVLKKRFEGAETRLTGGVATTGEPAELQFAQTFGHAWSGGSAIVSYEYYRRDALDSSDREIARDADLRRLGGSDHRSDFSFPGNLLRLDPATGVNAPYWGVPPGQNGVGLQPADFRAGAINLYNRRLGVDILPRQERHSLYAAGNQALNDRVELSGEVRYGRREYAVDTTRNSGLLSVSSANPFFVSPIGADRHSVQYVFHELPNVRGGGSSESLGVSLGGEARLWGDWRAEAYGAFAQETGKGRADGLLNTLILGEALGSTPNRPDTAYNPAADGYFNLFAGEPANPPAVLAAIGGGYQAFQNRGRTRSLNFKADGSLFDLPGGAVQMAVGAQHRQESYRRRGENYVSTAAPVVSAPVDVSRKIDAVFAELRLPLVGAENRRAGVQRLEVSLAGRIERYDDFGTTRNPKLGVLWSPLEGVLARVSYGRSFRAPNLRELHDPPSNSSSLLPSGAGRVGALILAGGNPDLGPETAETWTAGLELRPPQAPGLQLSAGWFDIRFEDRIDQPVRTNLLTALDDPNVASFVRRIHPATNAEDRALIAALLADPATRPQVIGPPEAYGAILDGRYVNTAALRVSGVDLMASYSRDVGDDSFTFTANASHIYRYEQRFTPTATPIDFVGVATYPVDLRARAAIDWRRGSLGAGLAMNYVSAYEDALGVGVDAQTTFDLQLRFTAPERSSLKGAAATLSVRNLFDAGPPFYDNPAGIAYDATNADPVGRFVSLQLTKTW